MAEVRIQAIEKLVELNLSFNFPSSQTPQDNRADIRTKIDELSVYLVQKSFVSVVRTIAKSYELVERYKHSDDENSAKQLKDYVGKHIEQIFGYELVNPNGDTAQSNKNEISTLFSNIMSLVFSEDDADSKIILEKLKSYQK